ncbi:MAG: hypothetical protein U1F87_12655 [Kiritimatiellia bacterium]
MKQPLSGTPRAASAPGFLEVGQSLLPFLWRAGGNDASLHKEHIQLAAQRGA